MLGPAPRALFRPAVERLIAIGDLHGDLDKAREAFRAGGLTDAAGTWVGGRPPTQCPPRHSTHFQPSLVELTELSGVL